MINGTPRIRKFFPGSNTPQGFYSFYRHIVSPHEADCIYLIKGGPGTGKSTFMRRFAKDLHDDARTMELFYCSADPGSLDAVVVDGRVAIFDASTPHAVEPTYPGVVEHLLNFGDFWDVAGLSRHRESITEMTTRKQRAYDESAQHLAVVFKVWEKAAQSKSPKVESTTVANKSAQKFIDQYVKQVLPGDGSHHPGAFQAHRRFFARAITSEGLVSHMNSIVNEVDTVVTVDETDPYPRHHVLQAIVGAARTRGVAVETFHSPFNPNVIEHVAIGPDEVAFVSQPQDPTDTAFVDALHQATRALGEAREAHHAVEAVYIKHMDFTKLEALYAHVLTQCAATLRASSPFART